VTPDRAQPILDDAEATLQTGDLSRAEALFQAVRSAEGPDAHQKAQAEAGLGEVALLLKAPGKAAEHFHRAAHLDPGASAWLHYRLGEARMRAGEWPAAVAAFREALAAYPGEERHARAEVLGRLGRARVLSGDPGGEEDLLRAIDRDPLHAALHADLGDCLLGRKAWKEAGEAYGQAMALEPGNRDYAAARERAEAIARKLA
jgi:tetratricopeptide (TPR) repeat protein